MSSTKFNGDRTNKNRSTAGSERGLAGRGYPILFAKRLNSDSAFVSRVCSSLGHDEKSFERALAGSELGPTSVIDVSGGKSPVKYNLRIRWKDGSYSNIRAKTSTEAQIHLEKTESFVENFQARTGRLVSANVKDALLLFTARHADQKDILDSVPKEFVGEKIRQLEHKYNNRLTLASIYGYDEGMVPALFRWFRENIAEIFRYCFSSGAVLSREYFAEYLLYHQSDEVDASFEIYDLNSLCEKVARLTEDVLTEQITTGDKERIGSTIALPFGKIQYHLWAIQFRHNPDKIRSIARIPLKRNNFGANPKKLGHENEQRIAEELNSNKVFREHFCRRIGRRVSDFNSALAEGASAKKDSSVLGGKTTGKTDIVVCWKDGSRTNISVKMRAAGQAYLVSAKNFVGAYEAQFRVKVPPEVRRALELFIGEAPDAQKIVNGFEGRFSADLLVLSREQNFRLLFSMIKYYDANMAEQLLLWLKNKISTIFDLCFSAGAVKDRNLWANVLWYKNLVSHEGAGLDYMVPLHTVALALEKGKARNVVAPGPKNGGSVIRLPFGHLQYHLKQLEFYQKLKDIRALVEEYYA